MRGIWHVEYDPLEDLEVCVEPVLAQTLSVDPTTVPPVSRMSGAIPLPIEKSDISPDGCSLWAKWGSVKEEGFEIHGYENDLTLELANSTTAKGTLTHSSYSGCDHSHVKFAAAATLE